jgi:hypothetical protein
MKYFRKFEFLLVKMVHILKWKFRDVTNLPRTAGWYAKTSLYHILHQVVPI